MCVRCGRLDVVRCVEMVPCAACLGWPPWQHCVRCNDRREVPMDCWRCNVCGYVWSDYPLILP